MSSTESKQASAAAQSQRLPMAASRKLLLTGCVLGAFSLVLATGLFALLIFEVRARIHKEEALVHPTMHPWLMMRPYGLWSFPGGTSETNEDGFRLPSDLTEAKPTGEFRIAILGGSVVFGHHLPTKFTFPGMLEGLVVPAQSSRARVLNFGISGYTSSNELVLLALHVIRYQPDLVIVFDGWNDRLAVGYLPHHNYFIEIQKRILDEINASASGARLAVDTLLGGTVSGRFLIPLLGMRPEAASNQLARDRIAAAERDKQRSVRSSESNAGRVYRDNLRAMAGILKAFAIDFIFVFQPCRAGPAGDEEYARLEGSFFEACKDESSSCYSLATVYDQFSPTPAVFHDSVHFTRHGGRLTAIILAQLVNGRFASPSTFTIANGRLVLRDLKAESGKRQPSFSLSSVPPP